MTLVTDVMIEAGRKATRPEDDCPPDELMARLFEAMISASDFGEEAAAVLVGDAVAAYPGCPLEWRIKPEYL